MHVHTHRIVLKRMFKDVSFDYKKNRPLYLNPCRQASALRFVLANASGSTTSHCCFLREMRPGVTAGVTESIHIYE